LTHLETDHVSPNRPGLGRLNWISLVLLGLIVLGLLARVWGISYGLPYLYHPDEPVGLRIALHIFKTGDLNPRFFGYGSLFFYLNALAYLPYYLIGQLLGLFHTPANIPNLQMLQMGVGQTLMPSQVILGRLLSVLEGIACIPVAYWLGKHLSHRNTGLLAAGLVAISAPLVLHSQFVTPNILTTLWVLIALAAFSQLTPQSRWPSYVWAGLALGCAIASKYNAGMLLGAYLVTCLMLYGRSAPRMWVIYLVPAVAVLTFIAVTPYSMFDFSQFIADTQFHLEYYSTASHPGMEGHTVAFYLSYLLRAEGPIVFLSVLPLVRYLRQRNRVGLILASFAVPYTIYVSTLNIRNDRTILIVLPIFLILSADYLVVLKHWATNSPKLRLKRVANWGLTIFVAGSILYLGWQTVKQNIQQTTPDAREYARQWIDTNLPTDLRIIAETYTPYIDPKRFTVTYINSMILNSPDWYVQNGYDVLVLSSVAFGRFYAMPDRYPAQIAKYDDLIRRFPEIMQFDQNNVTIRILRVVKS